MFFKYFNRSALGAYSITIWHCRTNKSEKYVILLSTNTDKSNILSYWVSDSDDSMQEDDIGVPELAHDGRLLQEPHLVALQGALFEALDGHHYCFTLTLPQSLADLGRVARANLLQ